MKRARSWWLPDDEQHLVKYVLRDDSYQAPHRAHALSYVKNWRGAIDIGAHVGLWTRDLAGRFQRVYAFEPIAEHCACFRENIPKQSVRNVTLFRCALSSDCRQVGFVYDPRSTGSTRVCKGDDYMTETLDRVFGANPGVNIDFIKIDVEGHEARVLEGGRRIILKHRPIVNIEQKFNADGCYFLESIGMRFLGRYSDEYVYGFEDAK